MLIKQQKSTSKCWKPDRGYLQVLISVHLGHVEVPFQLPQILYPLSAHTQAQDCSHPFQWPFKHTCSLHTHRHKTAVIHSSGHSNTHALCTHTGTRQQSSIPQPLEHIRFLHTQAQDCSYLLQQPFRHTCSLHTQAPFTCIILFYWIYRSKTD